MSEGEAKIADMAQKAAARHQQRHSSRHVSGPLHAEPITYEFTQDRALLHQYYLVREAMYRRFYNTDAFSGAEDEFDRHSHILVSRRGKLVIGGCRLTVREPGEEVTLPMESDDFQLRDLLKDFDLANTRHAEISRFAVATEEEHLQREIIMELVARMVEKMMEMNVKYMFFKSTRSWARNLRMIAYSMGLREHRICTEIAVPPIDIHPEIEWVLTYLELPVRLTERPAAVKEEQHPLWA